MISQGRFAQGAALSSCCLCFPHTLEANAQAALSLLQQGMQRNSGHGKDVEISKSNQTGNTCTQNYAAMLLCS